jgi:hypothetical protein
MRRNKCTLTHTTPECGNRFVSRVTAEETRDMISFCNLDMPVAPGVPEVETSTPAPESFSYVLQPELGLGTQRPELPLGIGSLHISMTSTLRTIGE